MTSLEQNLLEETNALIEEWGGDFSDEAFDAYNSKVTILLNYYGVSLDQYHELLLEKTEDTVENGD